MANTETKNFRYDRDQWRTAKGKADAMRNAGYDIDMSLVLRGAVDQFRTETIAETAERMGLKQSEDVVKQYRKPWARGGEANN